MTSTYSAEDAPLIIQRSEGWAALQLGDLWHYRELLFFLTWRDVKVRYKQSILGLSWVVIQPVVVMIIFSLIFGQFAHLPSNGIPYPIFTFAALLPWLLFSGSLSRAGSSLVQNSSLITKVYFPRLLVPLAAVLAGLVDFAVSLSVLLVLMIGYRITPGWQLLALPAATLLATLAALGFGVWLSALNVQFRDVQFVLPWFVQVLFFLSPIAYSTQLIPGGRAQLLYALNPMVGVIEMFRWSLFGGAPPNQFLVAAIVVTVVVLVTGLFYFRRMERTFADVV